MNTTQAAPCGPASAASTPSRLATLHKALAVESALEDYHMRRVDECGEKRRAIEAEIERLEEGCPS